MSILKVLLCVLVLASPSLTEASQPFANRPEMIYSGIQTQPRLNDVIKIITTQAKQFPGQLEDGYTFRVIYAASCIGVGDFETCLGNTDEFCPRSIPCQCKNEEPFCRCDYYRVGWKEYWYMGPKCNSLWNTLDFILVATLPAVILLILVVVIFSVVYCKKTEKAGKQPKPPSSGAQQNPAFSADTAASLEHEHHQPPEDAWVGQIPKAVLKRQDFNDAPIPNQRQNYSPMYAQPLRTADPASDYFPRSRAQWDEFDYPRKDLPYPVYPEARQYRRY